MVEESRGCMHAGDPEDGVAEGGVYFHDQLPQSMRLRDLGGDVESSSLCRYFRPSGMGVKSGPACTFRMRSADRRSTDIE